MDKLIAEFMKSDLTTPHECHAGYVYSDMGVDIEEESKFQEELHEIVDKMKEDLVEEKRILEGTLEPEYNPNVQNELSSSDTKEEQWRTDLPNGSLRIDLTHISNEESNTSFSSVNSLNRARLIHDYDEKYPEQPRLLCEETLANCGKETEPLSELSDCMEQMINVPMLGIPNEEK
jgi:hypothetical protein